MKEPYALAALAVLSVAARAGDGLPQGRCGAASDQAAIQQVIDDWRDDYNAGAPAKVAALYAEDATYLTQHFATGIVQGRAAIEAYVKLGTDAHYHIDSIRMLATACTGDFAYAITRYDATNSGRKDFGVNLVVLRKTGGRWLIAAHEAAVPDPAAAIQHLDVH